MKKTLLKRVFAFASALVIGGMSLIGAPTNVNAATLTEEQVATNIVYRDAITKLQTDWNMMIQSFGFTDVFGPKKMLVTAIGQGDNYTSTCIIDSTGYTQFFPDLLYSVETDTIRTSYMFGENTISYYYEPAKRITMMGRYYEYNLQTEEYTDLMAHKVITEEEFIAANETRIPSAVSLVGEYVYTEENLNKYLPISEVQMLFPTGEYTLDTVNLKVGEVFALSNLNIDKLISNEVVEINNGLQKLYFGDNVTVDANYVSKTLYYEFYDAATLKEVIKDGYWTAAESEEFYNTEKYGKWFYEGQEVIPVEEGEGVAYYNIRADKAGSTTVTISDYKIGDSTIKLTIPLNIIATNTEVPAVPETPSENVITSTTDSSVSVADSSNVLPAGTTMVTEKVESGDVFNSVIEVLADKVENAEKVAVYEINLTDSLGVELSQLSGTVKVTFNIPFAISEGKTIKVYRVEGTNLIPCNTTVSGDKVIFETDHFSTYVFVEENIDTSAAYYIAAMNGVSASDVVTAPKTGDSDIMVYVIVMLAAASIILVTKRNNARA